MRKTLAWLLTLAVLAGAGLYWRKTGVTPPASPDKPPPPVPVSVAPAVLADVPRIFEAVGRGEAYESVILKTRVDGQVMEVAFREGQHVAKGALLFRLDPADYSARLRQAEANLARDQADLARAQADLRRYAALKEQGFVSEEKLTELKAGVAALEAAARADQAAVELARLQLGYTRISAPCAGVVGASRVYPGSVVKTNDTELAVVNRIQPLYVGFSLPERHLPDLRRAMAAGPVAVEIALPDDTRRFTGRLVFVDNAVDPATASIRLKAELANADEALAPGQFVQVRLTLEVLKQVVTVPAEAVQQGPNGSFVFVVRPDRGVAIRPIRLADTRAGRVVVAQGLAAGESVVTDGHVRLTPKSRVNIKPARSPAP